MAMFPVIIPLVALLVPTRFLFSSRASRTRVSNLQHESKSRFVQVFANLQQGLSQATEDVLEQTGAPGVPPPMPIPPVRPHTIQTTGVSNSNKDTTTSPTTIHSPSVSSQPLLTQFQRAMLMGLNDLPNVHKHLVWITPARNTHAVVIWREPQFPGHARGEGVLRHWADHFIV